MSTLAYFKATNAIGALAEKIDYRGIPDREPRGLLGPPTMFEVKWPVASALAEIGLPSLDVLAEIIEQGSDPVKVAIAETAMIRMIGYQERNVYLLKRIAMTTDARVVERLRRYVVTFRRPREQTGSRGRDAVY